MCTVLCYGLGHRLLLSWSGNEASWFVYEQNSTLAVIYPASSTGSSVSTIVTALYSQNRRLAVTTTTHRHHRSSHFALSRQGGRNHWKFGLYSRMFSILFRSPPVVNQNPVPSSPKTRVYQPVQCSSCKAKGCYRSWSNGPSDIPCVSL